MKNYKNGFTMIELLFVVIILGVLATIAVPKFTSAKNSAELANAKSDVAAIRSAIITERQSSLVRGVSGYIPNLSTGATATVLFTGDGTRTLLNYGIRASTGAGGWSINNYAIKTYNFNSGTDTTVFTYSDVNGTFNCVADTNDCNALVD